jgi:hypothetical protein
LIIFDDDDSFDSCQHTMIRLPSYGER